MVNLIFWTKAHQIIHTCIKYTFFYNYITDQLINNRLQAVYHRISSYN